MKIAVSSDHRGLKLKQKVTKYLEEKGYNVIDFGTHSEKMTDYPIYAFKVGEIVASNEAEKGILICGTGIGMSIACNKVKGALCARVSNAEEAKLSRQHNDANVISFGENVPLDEVKKIVDVFLETSFLTDNRYKNRKNLIEGYDNGR